MLKIKYLTPVLILMGSLSLWSFRDVVALNQNFKPPVFTEAELNQFVFASCNNQRNPAPIWADIVAYKPQLFIYNGDTVYRRDLFWRTSLKEEYVTLDKDPVYRQARSQFPFFPTWDDHDFGEDDADETFKDKQDTRREFLEYWQGLEPMLAPQTLGVNYSFIVGKEHKVQFIILDMRYFRSELEPMPGEWRKGKYRPSQDPRKTFLGDQQWEWLAQELKKDAEVRFIVSAIQFVAEGNPFENWSRLPLQKQRMIDLLNRSNLKNTFFLTGDRHIGTIAQQNIGSFVLWDFTSSGINKTGRPENDPSYVAPAYNKVNFGAIQLDWKTRQLKMELHGLGVGVVQSQVVPLVN